MQTIVENAPGNSTASATPTTVQPTVVIEADRRWWRLDLHELWKYHELLYTLCWRDIKARYTQSVIGIGWAVINPLITIAILTIIFGYWVKIPSDGLPYPLFLFTALVPWLYFSKSLDRASTSVTAEANLITKVYFPRVIIPIASALGGLVDCLVGLVIVVAMGLWYGITPTWGILALPLFLGLALATALAVSLWFSALHVRYHDIGAIAPLLIQVWMYASPVVYPLSMVPDQWRFAYRLNPMVSVIEGFRWALLGKAPPDLFFLALSAGIVLVILYGGYLFFRKREQTFADVI